LKKYNLEIGKSNKNQITINGESSVSKKYFDLVSKIYLDALKTLDNDIESQYYAYQKHKFSPFFWCLTYDIYRDDAIKDNVLNYLIFELAKHFSQKNELSVTFFNHPGNNIFKHLSHINNVNVVIENKLFKSFKKNIRNTFGPLKVLIKYLSAFSIKESKDSLDFKNITEKHVFLANLNMSQTRWKGYPGSLNLKCKKGYFLDVDLKRCKSIDEDHQLNIKLFTIQNLFSALKDSFKLYRDFKTSLNIENSIFKEEIKQQSFLQTFTVMWRFYAWQEIFDKYNVTDIHVMTTFGDPFKRLPLAVANKRGAKGHVFACRPYLSEYRSEDRFIPIDKSEDSISQIPQDVIVLDTYSQNQLAKIGVLSKVYNPINKTIKYIGKEGILLLFSDFDYNENIIKLICDLKISKLNLFIREHPLVKLEAEQREKLKTISNSIIEINQYEWSELSFKKVLTFSANTTSGLDAVACGCELLWLPFLSQNFLQFTGYAEDTGRIVYSETEFLESISEYFNTKL
jgi:hypothetical protein